MDPKEIIIDISLGNDSFEEKQKEEIALTEEKRFDRILIHLKENLSKRFYKKTIKEIDSLLETDDIEKYLNSWKIYIFKIKAILSIIKNKITKYLIIHYDKMRIKHHINTINKYFNIIPIELNNFLEINKNKQIHTNFEIINELLQCYLDYIFLISLFHYKLGNTIDTVAYLSFILRLYKKTKLIPKTKKVNIKLEICFIFLINILINNEDYSTAIEYIDIAMDLCHKDIIYQTKDLSDGVHKFDKDNKNKEYNNEYNMNYSKRIILNIVFIFLYRSICYENTTRIINAVKCDYQSIWFLNHFYDSSFKYIYFLIKNILEKRIELKNAMDIIIKKIKYFESKKIVKKADNSKDEGNNKNNTKFLFSKKYRKLVDKLEKLKIPEMDLVNEFKAKINIKGLNNQNIEGKYKNNFLYGIRLYDTYLREDFRPIINSMQKIKTFDIDYHTQEKIQKFMRKIQYKQNQSNMKLNSFKTKNQYSQLSHLSIPDYNFSDKDKKIIKERNILKNLSMSTKNIGSKTKSRIFISSISRSKSLPDTNCFKSNSTKYKRKDILKNLKQSQTLDEIKEIRQKKLPKYKILKLTSICDGKEVFKENEKLNKFFNRKYLEKRAYIKKLEDRDYLFQKQVLKEKNTPKILFTPYNKELIRQKVDNKYHKILSLSVTSVPFWKENLTKEEYHRIKVFNRLEKIAISSLNQSSLKKFKEEEKKMRRNKYITFDESDNSQLKINKGNKSMIEKLNTNLEEINQREIIENKNFYRLYNENKKYIKHRNERNSSFLLRKEKEKEDNNNFE